MSNRFAGAGCCGRNRRMAAQIILLALPLAGPFQPEFETAPGAAVEELLDLARGLNPPKL